MPLTPVIETSGTRMNDLGVFEHSIRQYIQVLVLVGAESANAWAADEEQRSHSQGEGCGYRWQEDCQEVIVCSRFPRGSEASAIKAAMPAFAELL